MAGCKTPPRTELRGCSAKSWWHQKGQNPGFSWPETRSVSRMFCNKNYSCLSQIELGFSYLQPNIIWLIQWYCFKLVSSSVLPLAICPEILSWSFLSFSPKVRLIAITENTLNALPETFSLSYYHDLPFPNQHIHSYTHSKC